jgi:hypothetical protein
MRTDVIGVVLEVEVVVERARDVWETNRDRAIARDLAVESIDIVGIDTT